MRGRRSLLAWVFALPLFFPSGAPAAEPEEIWRQLGKLSGEERQRLLVSKAKEEGEVVWYSTLAVEQGEALREEFERRYPGVRATIWRGRGEAVVNRFLTESKAGKFAVDVLSGSNENLPVVMKANLVGRYTSPERRFYSDAHKDREGYWTSLVDVVAVIAYNTRLVSKADAPKKYEDFLEPKWMSSFAIDRNPDRAMMVWLKTWGKEKTEKFLQGLVRNGAAVRSGHNLTVQLLCAGEFKAAIEVYAFRVQSLKRQGCPVEIVFPDPTPGAVTPIYLGKRSPHPYAAALLMDYLLSDSGQRILVDKGLMHSGRQGIQPKVPELDLEQRRVKTLLLVPVDGEKLGKHYLELQSRYLLNR
ncbi:MAG TPA: extracellular solute-binding protein [Candidatus Binatia bacterium]